MSHGELIAAGYRQYKIADQWRYTDCFYQKRFEDEHGTRYFINVLHYPAKLVGEAWTVLLDCHSTPYRGALEFRYNNPPALAEAEAMVQRFWLEIAGGEYYEVGNV